MNEHRRKTDENNFFEYVNIFHICLILMKQWIQDERKPFRNDETVLVYFGCKSKKN